MIKQEKHPVTTEWGAGGEGETEMLGTDQVSPDSALTHQ